MWDTTLLSGGPQTVTSPFDDSQWSVTTGKQNSTAGGARTGQPSIFDALTPVANATYGAGVGGVTTAANPMGSMLPVLLMVGAAVALLVLVKHKHKG